jgi:putative DNA primase/helicase
LEQTLRGMPAVKLIIIDPVGSFLGGRTDAHRDNEVRAVLTPIAKIAEGSGAAVLIVAHSRKSVGASADDLALGSRAFTGLARSVWHLMRDPQVATRRRLLSGKNNLTKEGHGLAFALTGEPVASIRWEKDPVTMSADDALAAASVQDKPGPDPVALNCATEWLVGRVFAEARRRKARDIEEEAKVAGHHMRTVQRAKTKLGIASRRDQYGGEWCWELPATVPAPPVDDTVGAITR